MATAAALPRPAESAPAPVNAPTGSSAQSGAASPDRRLMAGAAVLLVAIAITIGLVVPLGSSSAGQATRPPVVSSTTPIGSNHVDGSFQLMNVNAAQLRSLSSALADLRASIALTSGAPIGSVVITNVADTCIPRTRVDYAIITSIPGTDVANTSFAFSVATSMNGPNIVPSVFGTLMSVYGPTLGSTLNDVTSLQNVVTVASNNVLPSPSISSTASVTATTSPTSTPSASVSASVVATTSVTPTSSVTATPTSSNTPTGTASVSVSVSQTVTATVSPSGSATGTVSQSSSATATASVTPTTSVTTSSTSSLTATSTASISGSATGTASPTASTTPTSSVTASQSITASVTPTASALVCTVSTIAGAGLSGRSNAAIGVNALFRFPFGIAADTANDMLFIADSGNSLIRRVILSTTAVTTLAGGSSVGQADGTGTSATFNGPQGIVATGNGILFVADSTNNIIRQIVVSSGVVTRLAGGGGANTNTAGTTDGTGTAALFSNPVGIAYDGTSTLYVADMNNHKIRSIVINTAVVNTVAGSGTAGNNDATGPAASFNYPAGITFTSGRLFVADSVNNVIRQISTSNNAVVTVAGGGASGGRAAGFANATGVAALFNALSGLSADSAGNVFVADYANNAIRKFVVASAAVTTVSGVFGTSPGSIDGQCASATFNGPYGIVASGGKLFVVDTSNHLVRTISNPLV